VRDVEQLHGLLQAHGAAATQAAFAHGLAARTFGAEYIAHYLASRADAHPPLALEQLG
jgi:hypothetical protein